jgi:hypothetical protein
MSTEKTQTNEPNEANESESMILHLETLHSQYNQLLIRYEQAVANYVGLLQQDSSDSLVSIPGQSFWGSGSLSSKESVSLQECQASCASTKGCTGATFNPDKQTCWLRSGKGPLIPSLPNDYAIVSKAESLLQTIESINVELTQVNQEILNVIQNGQSIYNTQTQNRKENTEQLMQEYHQLVKERNNIKKIVQQYQDLDERQVEGNLMVYQKYYLFLGWAAFVVFLLFLLYKFTDFSFFSSVQSGGGQLGTQVLYFIGIIVLFTLLMHWFSRTSR